MVPDGDGHHDGRRVQLADGGDRRPHARPGGQPVVDEDGRAAGEVGRRPVAAVRRLPLVEHPPLLGGDGVDDRSREVGDDVGVEDPAHLRWPTAPNASSSCPGTPSLRTVNDVKGGVERLGHLERHRHAAPRDAEHDDVGPAGPRAGQQRRQPGAGVDPVAEGGCHGRRRRLPIGGSDGSQFELGPQPLQEQPGSSGRCGGRCRRRPRAREAPPPMPPGRAHRPPGATRRPPPCDGRVVPGSPTGGWTTAPCRSCRGFPVPRHPAPQTGQGQLSDHGRRRRPLREPRRGRRGRRPHRVLRLDPGLRLRRPPRHGAGAPRAAGSTPSSTCPACGRRA